MMTRRAFKQWSLCPAKQAMYGRGLVSRLYTAADETHNSHVARQPPVAATPWRIEMKNFALSLKRFLVAEDGPTAVEYAVMLALIVIVCLTAIQAIGTNANTKFQAAADALK
jgi:pilus assembly protein Flp/PilA